MAKRKRLSKADKKRLRLLECWIAELFEQDSSYFDDLELRHAEALAEFRRQRLKVIRGGKK